MDHQGTAEDQNSRYYSITSKGLEIIEKYKDSSQTRIYLFPAYSIQKYNEYLLELADLCGINKRISSHVGRRTFGNYALSKGMSLNSIAKILGHANTLITQKIYAVTSEIIVSQEINKLLPETTNHRIIQRK